MFVEIAAELADRLVSDGVEVVAGDAREGTTPFTTSAGW